MKPEDVIRRLFILVEKLLDRQPASCQMEARIEALEQKIAQMEAVWPRIGG